jgi:SAM-dependent methyltransferase
VTTDAPGSSRPAAERARPRHLAADYAAQFADEEVAAAYQHRPPYPPQTFALVEPILGGRPRHVVELGAGTGDFTLGLALRVDRLVAVEPSRPMLERGRCRTEGVAPHVVWVPVAAEDYAFDRRCSAVVAAESFHWLDWHRVLPRISDGLAPGGFLILVERRLAEPPPWEADLRALIGQYSTNQHYAPYDVVSLLESRELIRLGGQSQTEPVFHRQSVESYVESFHSRNGFSRARLSIQRAREFDDALRALVARHGPGDEVSVPVLARVVWCRPIS